ncbi:MAG: hypothetical protein WCY67_11605 [Acidithiobacillus sp.]
MYRNHEFFANGSITLAPFSLPTEAENYLNRLGLTPAQRAWVEQQLLTNRMEETSNLAGGKKHWFAPMQYALAVLGNGDELNARLSTALPASRRSHNPSYWFRQQLAPPITRKSMWSKPFLRTYK